MTWFKRDQEITWFDSAKEQDKMSYFLDKFMENNLANH